MALVEGLLLVVVVDICEASPHQIDQGQWVQLEEIQRRSVLNHAFANCGLEKFPELVDGGTKPFIGRVPIFSTADRWELSEDFCEHFDEIHLDMGMKKDFSIY